MNSNAESAHIRVLSGLMAVRVRPNMYFGISQGDPDLPMTVLRWVIGDALTEQPADVALQITVTIEDDLTFVVEDNGPGLPIEPFLWEESTATRILTTLPVGRGPLVRGWGLATATGLCSLVVADIWHNGRHYRQKANWTGALGPLEDLDQPDSTETG